MSKPYQIFGTDVVWTKALVGHASEPERRMERPVSFRISSIVLWQPHGVQKDITEVSFVNGSKELVVIPYSEFTKVIAYPGVPIRQNEK